MHNRLIVLRLANKFEAQHFWKFKDIWNLL